MITKGVVETKKVAQELAKKSKGRIFALKGDLGAGKTTFVQAFLKALGVKGRVLSPTFVIMRSYQLKDGRRVHHLDAYRIKKDKELVDLGFKDLIKDKNNIILIEWADRIKKLLPTETIWLEFEHGKSSKERVIKIKK
jgi:tRNA threonylcarbamoyladenosine biosynthesis protein TsaE